MIVLGAFVLLLFASNFWMLVLFAVIYGFAHGGFATLISPLVGELFGLRSHGTILGIVIFFGTIGGAISPVFAGYLFDTTQSYQLVFIICIIMAVIGLTSSMVLRPVIANKS
jgi:MFS family permease